MKGKSIREQIGESYLTVYKNGGIKLAIGEIEFMNRGEQPHFNSRCVNISAKLIGVDTLLLSKELKEKDKKELANYMRKLANELEN